MPLPSQDQEVKRAEYEFPLLYKHRDADKYLNGIMRSYSEQGICFETRYAIKPGTEIFIIIKNGLNNPDIFENYEANYAEVEWCQETANAEAFFYKVGVKFFNF